MPEDKPLFEVEAQPPTPEEIERQQVREEYRAKLAEKLKDPEFRKIEGFPIGTDEAILALSDPPYYTACPNPFIEEWLKEHGKPFDPDTDEYHREPFAADVSEGKNHPIYNAHSYHTKVPHRAIMRYILHYTEPGDVVYDGFCGTGMTGVAAMLCGERSEVEVLGYKVDADGSVWERDSWESKQAIEAGRQNPHPHIPEPKAFSHLGVRNAILNDLSPAATFIAYNYNFPIEPALFRNNAKTTLESVEAECGWMYATLHDATASEIDALAVAVTACQTPEAVYAVLEQVRAKTHPALGEHSNAAVGRINYSVWSDVIVCPTCSSELNYFDVAVDEAIGKVRDSFLCPSCGTEIKKSGREPAKETFFDPAVGHTVTQVKRVPTVVNYCVHGKKTHQKRSDKVDEAILSCIRRFGAPYPFPVTEVPVGDETNRVLRQGMTHVHHIYFPAALAWLAALFSRANLGWQHLWGVFSMVNTASKRYGFVPQKPDYEGQGGGLLSGTLYIPSLIRSLSVVASVERSNSRLAKALDLLFEPSRRAFGSRIISTSSSTCRRFAQNSLDYIFVDPPFGGNLMYSELSLQWESWLGIRTNTVTEAITNNTQNKKLGEYQHLMSESFTTCFRALKPGRWMTVEFHNSANSVWNAIQEALEHVGFVIADVRILDKKQGNYHQRNAHGVVKADLVISCYKPSVSFESRFKQVEGKIEGVCEFIDEHLNMLPVPSVSPSGKLECLEERTRFLLFDRMVAYHLQRGARIPVSAAEFYQILDERLYERDGMYFLPPQAVRYDALKARGIEVEQLSFFVRDEKSAVQWVRNVLEREPHTLGELTPKFMQASQDWGQHEVMPELRDLLQQYFIREGDETWVVPDPDNEKHLEEVRRKAMLREFMEYVRRPGQLKLFRTEAVLAGFAHCWETKQYDVIVGVCEKIPPKVLQEIQDLVMFYDIAKERAPEKITQFEFKWE